MLEISAPLYTFSAGKVALSFYSEAELKYYFAHVKREPRTDRTLREEAAIRRQLKQIRITGFGYSRSELARGVVGTARAVTLDGTLAGILNISVPEARMDDRLLATIHEQLKSATAELSSILRRAGHHEIDRAIGHGHNRGVGVGADDFLGIIDASKTRRPSTPRTLSFGVSTADGSEFEPHPATADRVEVRHRHRLAISNQIGVRLDAEIGAKNLLDHAAHRCGFSDGAQITNAVDDRAEVARIAEIIRLDNWRRRRIGRPQAHAAAD